MAHAQRLGRRRVVFVPDGGANAAAGASGGSAAAVLNGTVPAMALHRPDERQYYVTPRGPTNAEPDGPMTEVL